MIPYGRQNISDDDIEAVVSVLRSDWLTQGPTVPAFENALATRCGVQHAVAVSNATAALHLACLALDVGPGDTVWTSPNTFLASANCARYCGANVDFVDIDRDTLNMSVEALANKLRQACAENCLPKVIIPVHFAGQPCDMAAIGKLAKDYGCRVIEDAAHAIGATYQGLPTGNCANSDITIFSFHPVKIITTGEGGMALTNSPYLAERLARLRSHGMIRAPEALTKESDGPWYYEQQELGFNYRMTDLQAALGASQLNRLDSFLDARRAVAARYPTLLSGLPVTLPYSAPERQSAWHLFPIQVSPEKRRALFEAMRADQIGVQVHYFPVHLQPYYRKLGFNPGDFPNAEAYYRGAFSLPIYPTLSEAEQEKVAQSLKKAMA
jgi:UDP-4-amino-4,6-dideoxy-N-acetyl-beta-L-altrosamine transaminase